MKERANSRKLNNWQTRFFKEKIKIKKHLLIEFQEAQGLMKPLKFTTPQIEKISELSFQDYRQRTKKNLFKTNRKLIELLMT